MSLVPVLILVSTLWTAGKAINYIIAFAFIMVLIDLISTNFQSGNRKILVSSLLIGWGMLQIAFAVSRVQTVQMSYSPHSFPPYVSIQNANLKTQQNWLFPMANEKSGCQAVELDITEPFQRYYAQMRLNEGGVRWYDKNPINTYFGNGADIGNMKQLKSANICVLQNSLNKEKAGFEFTLVQKR
jgi:hypothetical protein